MTAPRRFEIGAAEEAGPALDYFNYVFNYVEAERRWELRESALFTFARATLSEAPAP